MQYIKDVEKEFDMAGCCGNQTEVPKPLRFYFKDYLKVLLSWILSYRRTFSIEPGLYYTGSEYKVDDTMIVTCNYQMTVFLVWRKLRRIPTRILVIDTKGINVWCSAGKGQFNAQEILKQLAKYPKETLTKESKLTLILPKLSLSGVRLSDLREYDINPIIGPIYLEDLPSFLVNKPYKNSVETHYKFDIRDRLFTLLPSFLQLTVYLGIIAIFLGGLHLWLKTGIWWQIIPMGLIISTLYILGFPLLPTRSFAKKGMSLFMILFAPYFALLVRMDIHGIQDWIFYLSFAFGSSLLFGLYYTGNSGVSNYSIVRRETITYLPISLFVFAISLGSLIWKGVLS
jgi:hypothetical protein